MEISSVAMIRERLTAVQQKINRACDRAKRDPAEVTLVCVTKTWPTELNIAAYEAGMRHFGENRAEELARKQAEVTTVLGENSGVAWHQIGTLQSRKTGLVAAHADVFHALDRVKIARRLSRELGEGNGRFLPTFLEVNLSGETSKSGFTSHKWEEDATQREQLRKVVEEISQMPNIQLEGLMTMAPWGIAPEKIRQVFRRTHELSLWLQDNLPHLSISQLSMGMTDDFEIGIEEGATHIRIGRALFGSRK